MRNEGLLSSCLESPLSVSEPMVGLDMAFSSTSHHEAIVIVPLLGVCCFHCFHNNALIAFGLSDHLLRTDIVVPIVHLTCEGWFLGSVKGGQFYGVLPRAWWVGCIGMWLEGKE